MCKVVFNIYWLRLCSRPLVIVLTNSWVVVIESVFLDSAHTDSGPVCFLLLLLGLFHEQ